MIVQSVYLYNIFDNIRNLIIIVDSQDSILGTVGTTTSAPSTPQYVNLGSSYNVGDSYSAPAPPPAYQPAKQEAPAPPPAYEAPAPAPEKEEAPAPPPAYAAPAPAPAYAAPAPAPAYAAPAPFTAFGGGASYGAYQVSMK